MVLMAEAAESARQACHCSEVARRDGLRGEGVCTRSMGMARALEAAAPGVAGKAREICKKRLAQIKLSAKWGPSGSRRQEVPLICCPRLRTNVSSMSATTGAE